MKDRLIKREEETDRGDRTIVAENNGSMHVTAGESGDGAVAQRKRRKSPGERGREQSGGLMKT